ncbi:solute carrier family 39 (zinc transporter), member 1/2/3 [Sporothrix schenckii 1099-18]|uniref:Solute carrier family 39 (Zinc transporter), member 1/2/3 n=1 Tax=Sporothrix schenckii 1099-18 TaxID=1397361 RepID=A0A0F2MMB4_SPOSC|nr:solute carrier family 39 (zinc transporter), member 1/2/3 [Sporothrix schenckii 1099-18]KJR89326.1 solute carrier family 39 (zinc transporter), member 1/2/3 [Sporothrix schenckii 1099-18]
MKRYHHSLANQDCHVVREYSYLPIMRHYVLERETAAADVVPQCSGWGTDLSDKGLRIASVFIILAGSMLGVFLPIVLARTSANSRSSQMAFFVCKYFGSGVILATAFMHLLSPAVEALSDDCLSNILPKYDWGHVICLIAIMVMFYIELMAMRFNFSFGHSESGAHSHGSPAPASSDISKKTNGHGHGHGHSNGQAKLASGRAASLHSVRSVNYNANTNGNNTNNNNNAPGMTEWRQSVNNSALSGLAAYATANLERDRDPNHEPDLETGTTSLSVDSASSQNKKEVNTAATGSTALDGVVLAAATTRTQSRNGGLPKQLNYPPGNEDHLAHDHEHVNGDSHANYGSQIVSLLILEFGVIFHSLFIGLSLAGSDNLRVLLIVIAFHQFFEGLGLGSRLAVASWPSNWKAWTGYLMALGYGVTTPIGIAIGLGVNAGLNSRPDLAQLINGIFDAVSAGILVYTALVELLAHEFMFNPEMRDAKLSVQMLAFLCVSVGVGLMALLAKWA